VPTGAGAAIEWLLSAVVGRPRAADIQLKARSKCLLEVVRLGTRRRKQESENAILIPWRKKGKRNGVYSSKKR
jgi:hypothetical protein